MLRNLTPHPVTIVTEDGQTLSLDPEPTPARVQVGQLGEPGYILHDGVAVQVITEFAGDVVGLPDPEPGVWLIVSRPVAHAAWDPDDPRDDLLVPGETIRDENGRVVGCRNLTIPAV